MAIPYNNPVDLLGGFKRLYNGPLDDSYVVGTQSDLSIIDNQYGGLLSYVEGLDAFYYYDGSIWKEFIGGGGDVAGVTNSIQVRGIDGLHAGYNDFLWSDANKKLQLGLSAFKQVNERIELYDDTDNHYMDLVGSWYKGIDPINPDRFDISVKATVPSGKATITLQDNYSSALMIIAGNKKFQQFNSVTDHIEFFKGIKLLGTVPAGDATMTSLVLDDLTGEIKLFGAPGGGATITDVEANVEAGSIIIGEIVTAGTDLQTFVEQLLTDIFPPTMSLNYATCGGVSGGTLEVGTLYTTTLTASYNPGTIYSADGSPNIDLTGAATTAVFSGVGVIGASVSMNIALGANVWNLVQDYDAGTGLYYDSDGISSGIFDGFRVAGSDSDNSSIITGKYKYWWSAGSIPTTSAGVRALPDGGFFPVSTFDISIPIGIKPISFYVPDTVGSITVFLVESNADVTLTFTQTAMNVDDANANPVGYTRWETTIPGIGYSDIVTYRITIT